MYVAVKGGERAIENAHALLADARRGDRAVAEISLEQISQQLALAVDRVMAEGSLYDRELAALAQGGEVADWIRLHAGARVTSDPAEAAFAFIADPAHAPAFDVFSPGTPEYPDRSATLVLQVDDFGGGEGLSLSGPGIADARAFSARPLPGDFPARIAANRALFPRGVDVVLVSPEAVAALPRSVRAQRG